MAMSNYQRVIALVWNLRCLSTILHKAFTSDANGTVFDKCGHSLTVSCCFPSGGFKMWPGTVSSVDFCSYYLKSRVLHWYL